MGIVGAFVLRRKDQSPFHPPLVFKPALLRVVVAVALVGFVASVAVHVLSFEETGSPLGDGVFALHVGVFVVFAPVVLALVELGRQRGIGLADKQSQQRFLMDLARALPVWQKVALGAAFAYAMVNVALAFAGGLDSASEVPMERMFSGHWMFFYLLSALLAGRLAVLDPLTLSRPPGA